jgi:hypothetical protein
MAQMAQIKGLLLFVISVVKRSNGIFGVNETEAYYGRLEKTYSARYEINMWE